MTRIGVVLETSGPEAQVSMSPQGSCEGCSDQGACGMLGTPPGSRNQLITARNTVGAKTGDAVEIDLPRHGELKLSFLVWVVPLIGLIGGLFPAIRAARLPIASALREL